MPRTKTKSVRAAPQQIEFFKTRATRILIVDDHELVREGLRLLIANESNMEVCGDADNEIKARQQVRRLQPDVVIVDLTLQDGDGLDLIKWITKEQPKAKCVVSTMHEERIYGERALRAGARGYVNKQDPARTILKTIPRVLEGKLCFSEELISHVLLQQAMPESLPLDSSPLESLSDRELSVFRLIGQGMTPGDIAAKLHLSRSTVDTYRERLKTKLGVATGAELSYQAIHWCGREA